MKERPILFSGPMVRELLAGRKSQTRRPVKGLDIRGPHPPDTFDVYKNDRWVGAFGRDGRGNATSLCPYGAPDDRLWVRETWQQVPPTPQLLRGWPGIGDRPRGPSKWNPAAAIIWRADGEMPVKDRWRPGIHMPRWASRLLLEVTEVRVERLDAITEEDARAEGMTFDGRWWLGADHRIKGTPTCWPDAAAAFRSRWDALYAGSNFAANRDPWVWVVSFRRVEAARSAA